MIRPSKEERLKYNVDYPQDTEFSAYARLLQSKWRTEKGFPEQKLGNFLEVEFAKQTKSNFLTENIRVLVTQEVANAKKARGLISEPRIWNNLLSSQPLCFNLFGELHFDLDLATKFFKKLFPEKVDKVTDVKFEYSPGRGNIKYIADHSAFDVFIEYNGFGTKGFIGIEVKYAESLKEETIEKANKNYKDVYATVTNACGIFKDGAIDQLPLPPLSQIWRDHLLSIATKKDYDEGFFVFLFPFKNKYCQVGVDNYCQHLTSDKEEENGFRPRYLEQFINTLLELWDKDWTKELKKRYLGD
jgi:hypothetical protein